jgi:hypothetical protein
MWGRVDSLGYPSSLPLFPTADEKQERSIPVIAVEKIRENLHKKLFCSNDRNGGKERSCPFISFIRCVSVKSHMR